MIHLPLRELMDNAADALVIEDHSERIVYVNSKTCSLFGYSVSELHAMRTTDLEAASFPIIPSHKIYTDEQASPHSVFTTLAQKKDGSSFLIEVSLSRVNFDGLSYILSIIRDVKAQDRIHQSFLESSLRYQKLVEDSLQGIAVIYMSPMRLAFINYPLADIFGFSVDELTEMTEDTIILCIHPDDRDLVFRSFSDIYDHQKDRVSSEFRIIRKNGDVRCVEVFSCYIEYRDRPAIQSVFVDVTHSRETEESLKQTRDQLQAILDAIPGAASWVTSDLIYLGMNKKLANLFEKPQSFFVGKKVGFYQPGSDFCRFASAFFASEDDSASDEIVLDLRDRSPSYLVFGQKYDGGQSAVFIAIEITGRKKAEEELRKSEERFRRLVEYNPGAIIVHCEGSIVYANSAALKMVSAQSSKDVIGQPVMGFVHPDYRKTVIDRINKTQQNGQVGEALEEKFLSLDGRVIDVEVTAIPTLYNDKPATQVLFWDITDRKKAIESLRKSEALSNAIIEGSPTGVSVRAANGRLISVNDAWKRIWQIPDDELHTDFIRPRKELQFDDRDEYLKGYQEAVRSVYEKGGSLQIPEIRILGKRRQSAKWISQYFYALTDQKGAVEQVVILTADITARKEAAEALLRKDKILESVSKVAGILLYAEEFRHALDESVRHLGEGTDVSRVYVFQNMISESGSVMSSQISEWTAPGIEPQINNPDLQNIPLVDAGFERWQQEMSRGDVIYGSVGTMPPDEKSFLELQGIRSILVMPIFAENKWWGFIGFDHCLEERTWSQAEIGALRSAAGILGSTIVRNLREEEIRKMNEELEERIGWRTQDLQIANTALEESLQTIQQTYAQLIQSEKMAALGNLVAGIAHEINTPVGIGVTAASHLVEKTQAFNVMEEKHEMAAIRRFVSHTNESARIILTNLQRASDLIQSFKQVAVDQASEQKRVFYFKQYLDSIILSLKPELKKMDDLKIIVDCPESLHIQSRPGVFSQIITNLVLNSIRHGFEGRQSGELRISVQKSENRMILIHEDNGCGISDEHIGSIFEPFFTTKRGRGGSGLGLNLVYNLVSKNLNGSIRCETEKGFFTRFIIEFPVA